MHQNCLEGWLKHRLLGPIPIVSDSVGLGWGLTICIAKTFPGEADAANLGNRVREPQFYRNSREAAHISIIYLICCRLFIPHQILKQTEDCFSIFPRIPKGRSLGLSEESPPKDHRQFFYPRLCSSFCTWVSFSLSAKIPTQHRRACLLSRDHRTLHAEHQVAS